MGRRYRPPRSSAPVGGTELGKSGTQGRRTTGSFERIADDRHQVVGEPEVGEVLEREIDRPAHGTRGTEITKFLELALPASRVAAGGLEVGAHVATLRLATDLTLNRY